MSDDADHEDTVEAGIEDVAEATEEQAASGQEIQDSVLRLESDD